MGKASSDTTKAIKRAKDKAASQTEMVSEVTGFIGLDPVINNMIKSVLTPSVHSTIQLF